MLKKILFLLLLSTAIIVWLPLSPRDKINTWIVSNVEYQQQHPKDNKKFKSNHYSLLIHPIILVKFCWISCQSNIKIRPRICFSHGKNPGLYFSFINNFRKYHQKCCKKRTFFKFWAKFKHYAQTLQYSFLFILCSFFLSAQTSINPSFFEKY